MKRLLLVVVVLVEGCAGAARSRLSAYERQIVGRLGLSASEVVFDAPQPAMRFPKPAAPRLTSGPPEWIGEIVRVHDRRKRLELVGFFESGVLVAIESAESAGDIFTFSSGGIPMERPNKAVQPTTTSVMPRADERRIE